MKKYFIIAAAATLLSASAFGQGAAGVIAKQRAKEQVNQSNVRQGVTPPVQPAAPASGTTTSPAQTQSLTRLQSALSAFHSDAVFTAEQKQKFASELSAAALGAKPTPAATAKLAEDMAAVLGGRPLPSDSRSRLATELDAVLNPSKYPQAKMQAIFDDIQAIFQSNGADRKHAVTIVDSVKALAAK